MAISRSDPDPIVCFEEPHHRPQPLPLADSLVRRKDGIALSGRCPSCRRRLESVPAEVALVDIFKLPDPWQRGTAPDHDDLAGAPV